MPTFHPNSSCAEARWSSLEPRRDLIRSGIRSEYLLRLREAYVAEPAVDMIAVRRFEAHKLDLALRGLSLAPAHTESHVLRRSLWTCWSPTTSAPDEREPNCRSAYERSPKL